MELPKEWQYLKLDLFDNASNEDLMLNKNKLKLGISFKRKDEPYNTWHRFRAAMNSPLRHLTRGTQASQHLAHYKLVRTTVEEIKAEWGSKIERINASKFYSRRDEANKTRKSVDGFSAIVTKLDNNWLATMVIKQDVYHYALNGEDITYQQRRGRIIASATAYHEYAYDMDSIDNYL